MINKIFLSLSIFFILFVSGCSTHQPGFETPVVSITSFEPVPTGGLVPQFKIGLKIINPNRTMLILEGVSYTIALEGHKIMTGVSNQLPEIEAYGEGDVELIAAVDIFSSIGFFSDLIRNQQKDTISYTLKAKLDAGSSYRLIKVTKKGTFSRTQPDAVK